MDPSRFPTATTGTPGTTAVTATAMTKGGTGYQSMIDAESVDEFVHSQTTRASDKYRKDIIQLNEDERKIERFIANGPKCRSDKVACYDEVLEIADPDFFVHANTFKSPWGNFIMSQAPISSTIGDHLHLIWLYNVRTIVSMVGAEETGGYFSRDVGSSVSIFLKYSMTTLSIYDEKQGVTVYQCELKSHKADKKMGMNKRMIYIITCPTQLLGVRAYRTQTVALEYMWAMEDVLALEGQTTCVLVHGVTGTRRTSSFVAGAIMCKQILETGKFGSMDTWVELRKRRCHACSKQDFYSSLFLVFMFCIQASFVSSNNDAFKKTIEAIRTELELCAKPEKDKDD